MRVLEDSTGNTAKYLVSSMYAATLERLGGLEAITNHKTITLLNIAD